MKINHPLSFLTLIILSVLYGCKLSPTKSNKKSPNFIIILVDDQGWNGTSVQMMDDEIQSKSDYHQTPNIEALANRGMRFSSAYASAPVCSPSRYSIQFGQTPARLKMIRVGYALFILKVLECLYSYVDEQMTKFRVFFSYFDLLHMSLDVCFHIGDKR